MTEEAVGFLYKISTTITHKCSSKKLEYLKSYYLMRCHKLTKSYGLPTRQFSNKIRCSYCCIEWRPNNYTSKVKPKIISKKQRRKCKIKGNGNPNSNIMERLCLLCNKTTCFEMEKSNTNKQIVVPKVDLVGHETITDSKQEQNSKKYGSVKKIPEATLYSNTNSIFSLDNKGNKISQYCDAPTKVIKNNKKKKDKFAGLCQEAVLSAARMASDKDKKNKLNLFLKPSQGH